MFFDTQRALDAHNRQAQGQQHKLLRLNESRDFDQIKPAAEKPPRRPPPTPRAVVRDRVVATIAASRRPMTATAVAKALGIRKQAAHAAVTSAVTAGLLQIAGHRVAQFGPWIARTYRVKEQR